MTSFSDLLPGQCQYPLGKLLEPSTEWCGEPVHVGKPYCQKHCERAYQKKAEPKEQPGFKLSNLSRHVDSA